MRPELKTGLQSPHSSRPAS